MNIRHRIAALLLAAFVILSCCSCSAVDKIIPDNNTPDNSEADGINPENLIGLQYEGYDNLYHLNNGTDFGPCDYVTYIDVCDAHYAISYMYNDVLHCAVYDFSKGSITADETIDLDLSVNGDGEGSGFESFYDGLHTCGPDYLYAASQGSVYFYDTKLQPVSTVDCGSAAYYCGGVGYVVAYSDDSNEFTLIYADGSEQSFTATDAAYGFPGYCGSDTILLQCYTEWYDPIIVMYDIASQTQRCSGIVPLMFSITDGWLIDSSSFPYSTLYDPANLGLGLTYKLNSNESISRIADDGFITWEADYEEHLFYINRYLFETGTICDSLSLDNADNPWIYHNSIHKTFDYIIFALYNNETIEFLIWHTEPQPETAYIDSVGSTDYNTKNYENASAVLDEYNIGLYYGDNVNEIDFIDYSADMCYDSQQISDAIDIIKDCFYKMPTGFIDDVNAGYDGFDIYLTGTIRPAGDGSISDAAAFVTIIDNRQIMVIDVSYSYGLDITFAHEFMHIIENTISANYYMELFPDWDSYNPESFSYYYGYLADDGSTISSWNSPEYTDYDQYGGTDNIYFVDGYSKTFPNEDRARIFESLFSGNADTQPCFNSPHLQAKAKYLCQCLRDNFSSLAACDDIWWERDLSF